MPRYKNDASTLLALGFFLVFSIILVWHWEVSHLFSCSGLLFIPCFCSSVESRSGALVGIFSRLPLVVWSCLEHGGIESFFNVLDMYSLCLFGIFVFPFFLPFPHLLFLFLVGSVSLSLTLPPSKYRPSSRSAYFPLFKAENLAGSSSSHCIATCSAQWLGPLLSG